MGSNVAAYVKLRDPLLIYGDKQQPKALVSSLSR